MSDVNLTFFSHIRINPRKNGDITNYFRKGEIKKMKNKLTIMVVFFFLCSAIFIQTIKPSNAMEGKAVSGYEVYYTPKPTVIPNLPIKEEPVPVVTSTPVPTKNSFIPIQECPWSLEEQKSIHKICKKYHISFELCIAQAKQESSWDEKASGDNGKAYGAWQIHPAVWSDELKRWGYTWNDMYQVEKACDAYCRIMKAHIKKNNIRFALMAWRWGGDEAANKLKNGVIDKYTNQILKRASLYEKTRTKR